MPINYNMWSELLGVEATDPEALRVGLANSPLANPNAIASAASAHNTISEHFNGASTIPRGFTLTSEGTTTAAATYGTGLGGRAVITSDDVAAKTEQLSTQLLWQLNRQATGDPLIAEVWFKTGATITASEYFVGITDAVADTDPIALSATSTFTTSVPTNGVYMGYSATPTSGAAFTTGGNQHVCISINADTNAVVGVGGGAFAGDTDYKYRFEVDNTGSCDYYLNGTKLFTKAAALAVNVPLCLSMWAAPRTTVSAALSIDFAFISGA